MKTELLLASLLEELLKVAKGVELSFRSFLKALFLMSRLFVGRGLGAFVMFWLESPKLVKKVSPTEVRELDNSHKRSHGNWGHAPPLP